MMEFKVKDYEYSLGEHHGKRVIWITFPYDVQKKNHLRQYIKTAKWSPSHKAWYVVDNKHYRVLFNLPEKGVGEHILKRIHPINQQEFIHFMDQIQLKGYSQNTLKTYSIEFAQLLYLLNDFPVKNLTPDRLKDYFLYCLYKLKMTENQLHSRLNALKFYFEQVLHNEKFFFDIPRPKNPKQLPKHLSKKEVSKLLEVTTNKKHLLILKMAYGLGLRVSEIVNLKVEDIDSENMLVHVRKAKVKKDRYVPLLESVLTDLRAYYKNYLPKVFLFEGMYGDQYAKRSVQAVFKRAMNKAGIKKRVGIHSLRPSYATLLMEMGTDMSFIQKLLGHSNIKTTQIYAQISSKHIGNIKSPLDSLDEE